MAEPTVKEAIYDAEVSPLMRQIIAICKRHKIAMLAEFALGTNTEGQDVGCTSGLLDNEYEPTPRQLAAWYELRERE